MALTPLEQNIGYSFKDKGLLARALCHRSYVNESPEPAENNERLEFLGDAVLSLSVGHLLMQRCPDQQEGDLSRRRADLVNETHLAGIARKIELGRFLRLGRGETLSGGAEKNSILADAFEALLGAIFLEAGYNAVFRLIRTRFFDEAAPPEGLSPKDYKSRLQELVQQGSRSVPQYQMTHAGGPDHDKTFSVHLTLGELSVEGIGKSKKSAEQDAARKALALLEGP